MVWDTNTPPSIVRKTGYHHDMYCMQYNTGVQYCMQYNTPVLYHIQIWDTDTPVSHTILVVLDTGYHPDIYCMQYNTPPCYALHEIQDTIKTRIVRDTIQHWVTHVKCTYHWPSKHVFPKTSLVIIFHAQHTLTNSWRKWVIQLQNDKQQSCDIEVTDNKLLS